MRPVTIELMHEQVRAIYRAATGVELADTDDDSLPDELLGPSDDLERRFAELDALVRANPILGERVPPFSFTPLVDVIDAGSELLVEIAATGVEPDDVHVIPKERELLVGGVRRGERVSNGRTYVLAEIPRGPFSRTIPLPCSVQPGASIEVRNGAIRIRLTKTERTNAAIEQQHARPQGHHHTTGE